MRIIGSTTEIVEVTTIIIQIILSCVFFALVLQLNVGDLPAGRVCVSVWLLVSPEWTCAGGGKREVNISALKFISWNKKKSSVINIPVNSIRLKE